MRIINELLIQPFSSLFPSYASKFSARSKLDDLRYMKKHLLYFGLILLTACYRNEAPMVTLPPNIVGAWMGGGFEFDKEVYLPVAQMMQFDSNGTYYGQWMNNTEMDTFEWRIHNDSLQVDTSAFSLHDFDIKREQFAWGERYTRHYHRMDDYPVLVMDTLSAQEILQRSTWVDGKEQLHFRKDHKFQMITDPKEGYASYCYRIDQFDGHLLLVKHGNQQECGVAYQFLEHIVQLDENQLTVIRWQGTDFEQVTYRAKAFKEEAFAKTKAFQLCNPYTYLYSPYQRFSARKVEYPGGLYSINKIFTEKYKPPRNAEGETGLIRIRFVVNCEGKAGMYEMLQLDRNYQIRKFDKRISRQLLQICRELQGWKPPEKVRGEVMDVYKFLTIKLKNGKIVEVFY